MNAKHFTVSETISIVIFLHTSTMALPQQQYKEGGGGITICILHEKVHSQYSQSHLNAESQAMEFWHAICGAKDKL